MMSAAKLESGRAQGRREARIVRAGGDVKVPRDQQPSAMRARGLKWNGYAWVPAR